MDFFARQDQARRKTKWLVLYFALAVALLVVAVYFIALVAFAGVQAKQHHFNDAPIMTTQSARSVAFNSPRTAM